MRVAVILILVAILATTVAYSHYGYRSMRSRRMPMRRHYYRKRPKQDPTPPANCDPNFKTSKCLAKCPDGSLPIIGRQCPNGQKCCT